MSDCERGVYKALDLPCKVSPVWSMTMLMYYAEQKLSGRQLPQMLEEDDPHQLGGDVMLDSNGRVLLVHRTVTSSKDRPPAEKILQCLRQEQ